MKKTFTLGFLAGSKKTTMLALASTLFVISMVLVGCYEFTTVNQPSQAFTSSHFDVPLIAKQDAGGNDWTVPGLQDIGLFGILLPNGWIVKDSIPYTIISQDPAYNNTGLLVYSTIISQRLQDSLPAIFGYHWWGAKTNVVADMTLFDSLYFTPRIYTGSNTGVFYLRYSIGDEDYWDRNPSDYITDPIQITVTKPVGIQDILSKANVSVFPNPTQGLLNVNFDGYKSQVVQMNVFNSNGKLVMAKELLKSSNSFDISSLPKGVYVVDLKSGLNTSSSKIVVN